MDVEALFQIANATALAGWAMLLASPIAPRLAQAVAGQAIPIALSVAYAGLVLAFWFTAGGGFGALGDLKEMFETREILLAGWLHYLAFDLLVGAWIVRTARHEGIAFFAIVPCLALTVLFGPAGYLAFIALRAARLRGAKALPH